MSNIVRAFEKEADITEKGLTELKQQKTGLVIDVKTKEGMTAARKERTERNKLVDQIKRAAINAKTLIDEKRNELTGKVNEIYAPIVDAFEEEHKRQKEEKRNQEKIEQERINGIKSKIQGLANFAINLHGKSSEELSGIIEAVDMIDISEEFSEFTQEAMATKNETLLILNTALSGAIESEKIAKEREQLEKERAEFEEWKRSQNKTSYLEDGSEKEKVFIAKELSASCNTYDERERLQYFFGDEGMFSLLSDEDENEYNLEVVVKRVSLK